MPRKLSAYFVWLLLFAICAALVYFFPDNAFVQSSLVLPLIGAAFHFMRDEAEQERALRSQDRQFQFSIGASSFMAEKAFEKHIEFSEKYHTEVCDLLNTLWREGETAETLRHASKLYRCRLEFAIWLTDAIDESLDKFERAITKLGANARFIESTSDTPGYAESRILKLNENLDLFGKVLGLEKPEVSEEYAIEAVTKRLRTILGTEELTRLRDHLVEQSIKGIDRVD